MSGSQFFFPNKKRTHTFTSVGGHSLVIPAGVTEIRATLAGGGGGGSRISGLGGAGGSGGACKDVTLIVTPGETLSIQVGAGGAGGSVSDGRGKEGFSSSISGTFGTIVANGGYGTQPGASTPLLYSGGAGAYRNVGAGVGGTGNDSINVQSNGEAGLYGQAGSAAGHPNPGPGGGSYGPGGNVTAGAGGAGSLGGGGAGGNSADGGAGGSGIVIIRYGVIETF